MEGCTCYLLFQEWRKVEAQKRKEREEEASTALDLHGFAALICIDDVHLALR